jgi:hypothetical protein
MLARHPLCHVKPPCHTLPRQMNEELGIGSVMVADHDRFSQYMTIFNKHHKV